MKRPGGNTDIVARSTEGKLVSHSEDSEDTSDDMLFVSTENISKDIVSTTLDQSLAKEEEDIPILQVGGRSTSLPQGERQEWIQVNRKRIRQTRKPKRQRWKDNEMSQMWFRPTLEERVSKQQRRRKRIRWQHFHPILCNLLGWNDLGRNSARHTCTNL